jgi:hypothetical protein
MVEAAGIEPASEKGPGKASTCLVDHLILAQRSTIDSLSLCQPVKFYVLANRYRLHTIPHLLHPFRGSREGAPVDAQYYL